ncbi:MAG TPA: hypothetical protein VFL88_06685 [Gemmatimonadales bacterium]|jgi:hypothetical protein|nr:hypothetical protein [Gemmatimonadales bacterium]
MDWMAAAIEFVAGPLIRVSRLAPIATVGVLSALIPIHAGWRRRAELPPALRWALVYLAATFVEEMFMLYWSRSGRSNIWIINLYVPCGTILLGLMFAGWQLRERWRRVIYGVIAVFPVLWLLLMLTVEDFHRFPTYSQPIQSLLVLTVAAWTLIQRTRHAVSPVVRHPWYWVSVGVLFYFVYLLLVNPFSKLMVAQSPGLVRAAFEINGILATLMNLFWLRAFLLVRRPSKAEARA